jgi:hypothetical protein
VRAALRLEPEKPFLLEHLRDYRWKDPIEREVAPGQKIFSSSTRPEAYINRQIVVGYESTLGNLVQDILDTPLDHPPLFGRRFRFVPRNVLGLRIAPMVSAEANWDIAEVRLFHEGRELPRSADWHFRAWPNGAEAWLAFDGQPVTRWSTWQPMTPNCHIGLNFAQSKLIDEVVLEGLSSLAQVKVEVLPGGPGGRWISVEAAPEELRIQPSPDLRRAATREVKGRGIGFLLIDDTDSPAVDMKRNTSLWGLTLLAEANGTSFYRID